ncbi:hypothetical protein [Streptomyces sp. P17]|uniref:SCO2583/SCO2584 N-terminal domain-containing protein n=1 Tax=Streptomyces sp. P17 TaxID=3074716 RepID=UPI0028F43605|nr:hypothetical protein [Streptomyces sp. P17]MDT9695634.1 hypothetical protein [Streptomyces sp. P17]
MDEPHDNAWDDLVLDEEFVRSAGSSEPSARAPAGWFFSKGAVAGGVGAEAVYSVAANSGGGQDG